jgi:imidazolonepropionase-like amidohydrolase
MARAEDQACDLALTGGQVWTGDAFERRDIFIGDGHFLDGASAGDCQQSVDLDGAYASPPFADGHTHNVEAGWSFDSLNARYLEEGVFYVLNPLNMPAPARALSARIEANDTIEVAFTNGALTSYRGHPEFVYVVALSSILYGGAPREAFVGEAFHTIETLEDIEAALDTLQAQGADAVKIIVANTDNFEARSAFLAVDENWDAVVAASSDETLSDAERLAATEQTSVGLNPEIVPLVIERIQARGLRALAHIDTVTDFEVAVRAGVDGLLHMPGIAIGPGNSPEQGRLSDAAVAEAARRGVGIVLTAGVRPEFTPEADRPALHELQRGNISRLIEAGVPVYIGTDRWQAMASYEVGYLIEIGAMTPAQAFRAWVETSRIVFPDRSIGQIAPGYEADLLVFSGDPTQSLEAMGRIEHRIKGGAFLDLGD